MSFSWPWARLTTYVANSTPLVKAADLNALQDQLIVASAPTRAHDDFLTSLGGFWTITAGGSGTINQADDSTAGGFGTVQLYGFGSGSSALVVSTTGSYFGIGVGDFNVRYKARVDTTVTTGLTAVFLGLYDGSSVATSALINVGNTGFFNTYVGGSLAATSVALDTNYHIFDFVRSSGTLTISIDGTQVYSGAYSHSYTTGQLYMFSGGSSIFLVVDYVWARF